MVTLLVKNVIATSKVIKCELFNKFNLHRTAVTSKDVTIHNLKPGYLVSAKISKILDNGIEVNFLGGFNGTVFIDHADRDEPSKYKLNEKLNARIIAVDP